MHPNFRRFSDRAREMKGRPFSEIAAEMKRLKHAGHNPGLGRRGKLLALAGAGAVGWVLVKQHQAKVAAEQAALAQQQHTYQRHKIGGL